MNINEIVDKQSALKRLDGDEELYKRVCDVFMKHAPLQLEKLKEAVNLNQIEVADRQAHSLKSEAANIGAEAMRRQALEIEIAAKEKDMDRARNLLDKFENECERVLNVLPGLLERE